MTHASLFSGIGGPEVAASMLGWENAFHCEINPFGRAILEYWYPNSVSYEDITKTNFKEWRGRIDVLTGGFPCQPFSYAGQRRGQDDDRYLWPQMLRAIDEIRPAWVVGENVAGITTMVEGGLLADLGGSPTLFQEGDDLHGYELEQSFTIERICGDLERLGYSVQPVLIPAAAVGAPHRRDRIFIVAFDVNSDRSNDMRVARLNERESVCERVQKRDKVREPGEPDQLRSSLRKTASDTLCGRGGEGETEIHSRIADGDGAIRAGSEYDAANPADIGLSGAAHEGAEGEVCGEVGQEGHHPQRGLSASPAGRGGAAPDTDSGRHARPAQEVGESINALRGDRESYKRCAEGMRPGRDGQSPDSFRERLEREDEPGCEEGGERMHLRGNPAGHDWAGMLPGERWASFPTVPPVHRGNDGIPIRLDDLSISFSKWRTESLKAYGNAIVPQVMYRIFQAIESV